MSDSVRETAEAAHRAIAEIGRPAMAKADLRKAEIRDLRAEIGRCVEAARLVVGWTLDQLAREVERDPRQVQRWCSGLERPQFDVLLAIEPLREPLVVELARRFGAVVRTQIEFERRRA